MGLNAQKQIQTMSLDRAIELAKQQSPDALKAKHQLIASYWEYKTFKRGLMPQLTFNGTLPSYNRSIDEITQDDGTQAFHAINRMNYSASLDLRKNIGLTGADIYLSSALQSYRNMDPSNPTKNYLATPVNIGLNQPLFQYNPYKWNKQIEPLKYTKAKRAYLEANEQVAITAINYYFNLLSAQIGVKIAVLNEANYDTLFKIAKGRYASGKIAEDELLQLELKLLQSKTSLESVNLNLQNAQFKFKSFLRIDETINIELTTPSPNEISQVNTEKAISIAKENSSYLLDLEQSMLEAKSNVNRAKTQNGFNADLFLEFGLTKSDPNYKNIYTDPLDRQNAVLGIKVPILDWGLKEGQIKLAESQLDIIRTDSEQKQIDYKQTIYLQAAEYNMQERLLEIAAKSDTVARKSYDLTKNRYIIGKINVVELNIAQANKDQSEMAYINALKTYWRTYYLLRKMTLFDFEKDQPLNLVVDDFDIE